MHFSIKAVINSNPTWANLGQVIYNQSMVEYNYFVTTVNCFRNLFFEKLFIFRGALFVFLLKFSFIF